MKTYSLIKDGDGFRIAGTVSGIDAGLLNMFLMLETERGEYPIYDRSYGISRRMLYSARIPYAVSMLKRQITEEVEKRCGDDFKVSDISAVFDEGILKLTVHLNTHENQKTLTEVFNV